MKYYLIAGEASGDLHASNLMKALKVCDSQAEFRFIGGDLMKAVGGCCVKHYREMAYMGFIPVLTHLKTIFSTMNFCKKDILEWHPDVLILIDYPGFNLEIAAFVKKESRIPVYYYISPKIWAWKEYRIHSIKRDVDQLFSILPFEVPFYEKHGYPIHYVGNPCVDAVADFQSAYTETNTEFRKRNGLTDQPVIAILAGSRKQEIADNLSMMLAAARKFPSYQVVIAGAPSISQEQYSPYLKNGNVKIVFGETYPLLMHAEAALVTSGTATLETALFRVPQVVCYNMPLPGLMSFLRKLFLKVKYISLVNLICGKEVVTELVARDMNPSRIEKELASVLEGGNKRQKMLEDYQLMSAVLGNAGASSKTASLLIQCLQNR